MIAWITKSTFEHANKLVRNFVNGKNVARQIQTSSARLTSDPNVSDRAGPQTGHMIQTSNPSEQGTRTDQDKPHVKLRRPHGQKKFDTSRVPVLDEADLEEKFIHGSGPGGSRVNKSYNCCQLRHKPTGIVIKTHQKRELDENRKIARQILIERLDDLMNGEMSLQNQKKKLMLQRSEQKEAKQKYMRELRQQYKEKMSSSGASHADSADC